jgi:hypothetical protein
MTLTEIDSLQNRIETMLTEQWAEMPDPKPTYTEWFYGDGGPRDVINDLLNEMRDQVMKKIFVPGCIKSKNRYFRPISVCEGCEKKDDCTPYISTMEDLLKVAA